MIFYAEYVGPGSQLGSVWLGRSVGNLGYGNVLSFAAGVVACMLAWTVFGGAVVFDTLWSPVCEISAAVLRRPLLARLTPLGTMAAVALHAADSAPRPCTLARDGAGQWCRRLRRRRVDLAFGITHAGDPPVWRADPAVDADAWRIPRGAGSVGWILDGAHPAVPHRRSAGAGQRVGRFPDRACRLCLVELRAFAARRLTVWLSAVTATRPSYRGVTTSLEIAGRTSASNE